MNKKKLEINISKINNPMFPLFSTPSYKKVFSKENSIDKPISGGTKKIVFGQTIGGYGQGQAQQGQGLQQLTMTAHITPKTKPRTTVNTTSSQFTFEEKKLEEKKLEDKKKNNILQQNKSRDCLVNNIISNYNAHMESISQDRKKTLQEKIDRVDKEKEKDKTSSPSNQYFQLNSGNGNLLLLNQMTNTQTHFSNQINQTSTNTTNPPSQIYQASNNQQSQNTNPTLDKPLTKKEKLNNLRKLVLSTQKQISLTEKQLKFNNDMSKIITFEGRNHKGRNDNPDNKVKKKPIKSTKKGSVFSVGYKKQGTVSMTNAKEMGRDVKEVKEISREESRAEVKDDEEGRLSVREKKGIKGIDFKQLLRRILNEKPSQVKVDKIDKLEKFEKIEKTEKSDKKEKKLKHVKKKNSALVISNMRNTQINPNPNTINLNPNSNHTSDTHTIKPTINVNNNININISINSNYSQHSEKQSKPSSKEDNNQSNKDKSDSLIDKDNQLKRETFVGTVINKKRKDFRFDNDLFVKEDSIKKYDIIFNFINSNLKEISELVQNEEFSTISAKELNKDKDKDNDTINFTKKNSTFTSKDKSFLGLSLLINDEGIGGLGGGAGMCSGKRDENGGIDYVDYINQFNWSMSSLRSVGEEREDKEEREENSDKTININTLREYNIVVESGSDDIIMRKVATEVELDEDQKLEQIEKREEKCMIF